MIKVQEEIKEKKSITLFLIITILCSSIAEAVWIIDGEAALNMGINGILMWIPAIAALIVSRIYYKKEGILGIRRCKIKYILAAIVIPMIYLGLSYGIYWLCNPEAFTGDLMPLAAYAEMYSEGASEQTTGLVITMIVLVFSSILTATGEEIGWRGFLLPRMEKRWNFKKAVLVSGLIWAVWHMPIMIAGEYMPGTPLWYQLPLFTIEVLCIATVMSVLRMISGSVWPAVLVHASHNYVDQVVCMTLTDSKTSPYFVGETGIITVVVSILVTLIVVMIYRKKKLIE